MKTKRGYYILSQAWYGPANLKLKEEQNLVEEINFGLYADEGGGEWEASFRWYKFEQHEKISVKLGVFDDAFRLFKDHPKLLADLGKLKDTSVGAVIKLLEKHRFTDRTERKRK